MKNFKAHDVSTYIHITHIYLYGVCTCACACMCVCAFYSGYVLTYLEKFCSNVLFCQREYCTGRNHSKCSGVLICLILIAGGKLLVQWPDAWSVWDQSKLRAVFSGSTKTGNGFTMYENRVLMHCVCSLLFTKPSMSEESSGPGL